MKLKHISKKQDTGKPGDKELAGKGKGWMFLDLLLDEAKEILAFVDINLCYLHVNKAHADWLGLHKIDFTGKYVSESLNDTTFKKILPQFIKAFKGEHVYFSYLDNNHEVNIELIPTYESPTEIIGCIWLVKDNRLVKKSEKTNKQTASKINDFFELELSLIALISSEGIFHKVNDGWANFLGKKKSEIEQQNFLTYLHHDDIEKTQKALNKLPLSREPVNLINRIYTEDNSFHWLEWHLIKKGQYIYAITHDITNYINNLETFESTIDKLSELNSSKDQFFSIIAHDLKSPFNNILGFTELLRNNLDTYDKELVRQILGQLHSSSKMAYELLENLLDWSRLQTDRIEYEPTQLSFNELLRHCLPMMQLIASSKQISLEVTSATDLSVYADQNLTKTILRNLISNAVKFSNAKDKIYIKAEQIDNQIKISIRDKGIGIPMKDIPKLFRIDIKHSTPGTMNEKGTGLGLILCKDFVEKQGGKIWVESKENEGSTFTFTLPC